MAHPVAGGAWVSSAQSELGRTRWSEWSSGRAAVRLSIHEIHRLLGEDPQLPGQRIRELVEPLGFGGDETIVDDYLREIPPLLL